MYFIDPKISNERVVNKSIANLTLKQKTMEPSFHQHDELIKDYQPFQQHSEPIKYAINKKVQFPIYQSDLNQQANDSDNNSDQPSNKSTLNSKSDTFFTEITEISTQQYNKQQSNVKKFQPNAINTNLKNIIQNERYKYNNLPSLFDKTQNLEYENALNKQKNDIETLTISPNRYIPKTLGAVSAVCLFYGTPAPINILMPPNLPSKYGWIKPEEIIKYYDNSLNYSKQSNEKNFEKTVAEIVAYQYETILKMVVK